MPIAFLAFLCFEFIEESPLDDRDHFFATVSRPHFALCKMQSLLISSNNCYIMLVFGSPSLVERFFALVPNLIYSGHYWFDGALLIDFQHSLCSKTWLTIFDILAALFSDHHPLI